MLHVGTVGFGGGSALIPLIDRELVDRRRVLEPETFREHTVVASITPGALPVKLGALAGLHTSGAWMATAMAVAVALPGTLATLVLLSSIATGGAGAVRYAGFASVGITVFIIALLVHYIEKVVRTGDRQQRPAIVIAVGAFILTGVPASVELTGRLLGQEWAAPDAWRVSPVQLIALVLAVIVARALIRRERAPDLVDPGQTASWWDPRATRAALLLVLVCAAGVLVGAGVVGGGSLEILGLVVFSSLTSFGGGEAYVAVADGFFVAEGHISASVYYAQLVPVANALPGPILVKIAAGVGYVAGSETGVGHAWLLGGAAGLAAVTSCTAVAVVVMSMYRRAHRSAVVRDIGRYILPVICGLLATTSVSMLNAAGEVSQDAGVPAVPVLWVAILGVLLVVWARHRELVHDVLLLLACGAVSTVALLLAV